MMENIQKTSYAIRKSEKFKIAKEPVSLETPVGDEKITWAL